MRKAKVKPDLAQASLKQSNPKDAVGIRKARWFSYIPLRVLTGVGLAMLEGARKYGRHNYRCIGVRASVYVDAAVCGHLMPWMEGQDIDPESGLNHIDKALASLMVLRDAVYEGNMVDDRPPSVREWDAFMKGNHEKTVTIIETYKNPVAAFVKDPNAKT